MSGTPRMLLFGPGAPGELPTYVLTGGRQSWYVERPSPDDANTVTLFAWASTKAWRSCLSEANPLWNAPSPEPKLWLMTSMRWLSMSVCSAFIICWKPCTPRVSAVGVVTSMMLASGAVACAHSTSRATSRSQRLWLSWPVPLFGGGGTGGGPPWIWMMSKRGDALDGQLPEGSLGPLSPQRWGRPKAVLKTPRSSRMVEAPKESTTAIVFPG